MENFVVSARKYRPATFASVVGQRHITSTLKNAIERGQLAHAYLFCGPRGVGKTTCARIFAKAINGEKLTSDEVEKYKGALLIALGKIYNELGWVQQYHIGALRNNSARMFEKLGPDSGYDCINGSISTAE